MRLRELFFHEPVVIPGYVSISGGGSQYRDHAFHTDDGWTLERLERGVFSIHCEGMERPAIVEVCDCSYTRLPEPEPQHPFAEPEQVSEVVTAKRGRKH